MKVAYVFSTSGHTVSYKLGRMILPQLEQGTHGVEVVGMFFFAGYRDVAITATIQTSVLSGPWSSKARK